MLIFNHLQKHLFLGIFAAKTEKYRKSGKTRRENRDKEMQKSPKTGKKDVNAPKRREIFTEKTQEKR